MKEADQWCPPSLGHRAGRRITWADVRWRERSAKWLIATCARGFSLLIRFQMEKPTAEEPINMWYLWSGIKKHAEKKKSPGQLWLKVSVKPLLRIRLVGSARHGASRLIVLPLMTFSLISRYFQYRVDACCDVRFRSLLSSSGQHNSDCMMTGFLNGTNSPTIVDIQPSFFNVFNLIVLYEYKPPYVWSVGNIWQPLLLP